MHKWFHKYGAILTVYVLFFGSTVWYARQKIHFSGLPEWPSVPARNVVVKAYHSYAWTESRYSSGNSYSWDNVYTSYDYTVDGVDYHGSLGTANGAFPRYPPGGTDWQAYYNPNQPSIAVLYPEPYVVKRWQIICALSGVIVISHAFIRFRRRRCEKKRQRH